MNLYAIVTINEKDEPIIARGARQKLRVYSSIGHAKANLRRVSNGKIMEFSSGNMVEIQ